MSVSRLLENLKKDLDFADWIAHHERIPDKAPEGGPFPKNLPRAFISRPIIYSAIRVPALRNHF